MNLSDLYLARPAVGINTREFFRNEAKLARYLRDAADGQGVENPAEALQHLAHRRRLCEKPDSDWPGFFDETELEAEPEDDFFDVLTDYLTPHVDRPIYSAKDALHQLLPYGTFAKDGELYIHSREYFPMLRITPNSAEFLKQWAWIDHDQARFFALGDTRKSNLRDRADVLAIIVEALQSGELISERLDRHIAYAGDFRPLIHRLLSDEISYPKQVASRAA